MESAKQIKEAEAEEALKRQAAPTHIAEVVELYPMASIQYLRTPNRALHIPDNIILGEE